MSQKKSRINWKTISMAFGIALSLIGLASAWAITATKTEAVEKKAEKTDNEIDKVKEEVTELEKSVIKQTTIFEQQQIMNQAVIKILEKKK